MTLSKVIVACVAGVASVVCMAQTVGEQNLIAQDKKQVADLAAEANKACGTHIPMSVNYASFQGWKTNAANTNQQSPYSYFQNVTEALESVCGTDAGKAGVQAKIKSVVVFQGGSESESLAGGAFKYTVPFGQGTSQQIAKWLNDHM